MEQSDPLFVWRFTPVATADDPRWQDRPIWRELSVVAPAAGAAIIAAARHDQRSRGFDETDDPQYHQERRSGLEDPALYRCDRVDSAPSGAEAGSIISGEILVR